MNRPLLTFATAFALCATAAVAQPTVDGDLTDTEYTLLDTNEGGAATGFGVPDGSPSQNGSVLTAAYAYADPDTQTLYLGFGGTVEANFNKLLVYLDTRDGGYDNTDYGTAGENGGVSGFNSGGAFDDGFTADFVLDIRRGNASAANPSGDVFVDVVELAGTRSDDTDSITRTGFGDDDDDDGPVSVAVGQLPNQTSVNTTDIGIELAIPYSTTAASDDQPLVISQTSAALFAIITGQDGTFASNQTLSPLAPGTENLGTATVDFGTRAADPLSFMVEVAVSTDDSPNGRALSASALYPNPTAGEARLTLAAANAQAVTVEVFDVLGRRLATAFEGTVSAETAVTVSTAALAPGLYIVRVQGETAAETRLLTVTR